MPIRINNLTFPLEEDFDWTQELAHRLRVSPSEITDFHIIKQSVDARRKNHLKVVYSVSVSLRHDEPDKVTRLADCNISYLPAFEELETIAGDQELRTPPLIVGSGPAGMFAAYLLSKYGYHPVLIERGGDVDSRSQAVDDFWKNRRFSPENNVQFGEGGAGTFSDGKLTTRINDRRCREVLRLFKSFGAPEEILWQARPHIGTDLLKAVMKHMREEIIRLGGTVKFFSRLTDIRCENGISQAQINGEWIPCGVLILAIGHSARDTFEMLQERGVSMEAKPFSVGVRIEHPQRMLDQIQFGNYAGHPKLGHSEYQLAYKNKVRSVYTFCMCPGGLVVAAASEEGGVVTNGMSTHARDGLNANSAVVAEIKPEDLNGSTPLAGIYFQKELERKAFLAGGSNYNAPAQSVGGFLDKQSGGMPVMPTYRPDVTYTRLADCLPNSVVNALKDGLCCFDQKIHGFAMPNALLTGVETRTSSPVRILRGKDFQSVNVPGLYPAGEGAGYAGGIMSAAVDGIRVAEQIMQVYHPFDL